MRVQAVRVCLLLAVVFTLPFVIGGISCAPRPNVVLILLDDLRFDSFGATGHPFVQTPNIDRIASEGMSFRNAFVTTPLCSPGRASFYTGQYARSHGVRGNEQGNSVSDTTLRTWPSVLQGAGYHTALVGKWHMDPTSAPRHGFEHWAGFMSQGSHTDVTLNVNGVSVPTSGYTTDVLTDEAIAFLRQDHASRPFALVVAYKAVHGPFPTDGSNLPPSYRTLYENEPIPRAPSAQAGYTLDGKPMLQNPPPGLSPPVPGTTGATDGLIRNQLRMITHVDDNIGEILATLTQLGVLDQTLVIVTSDNGSLWGEQGLSDKRAPYEESIRVPLLMRHPGLVQAGSSSNALVLNVDLAPTLMLLAGSSPPEWVEGESLRPVMRNPSTGVRTEFLTEYWEEGGAPRIPDWKALRTARWKYITYPRLGPAYDELYDEESDPYEMVNRIGDAELVRNDLIASLARVERGLEPRRTPLLVPGSVLDYGITESRTVEQGRIIHRAGSQNALPAGGRNAVLLFGLPPLRPGDRVVEASARLTPASRPDRGIGASVHADLWAIGIGDGTSSSSFLESDTDPAPDHVKVGENLLWWDRPYGAVEINPDEAVALGAYLEDFYAMNPTYAGGEYLYLRLNPDSDTGQVDAGWDAITSEHSTPALRPLLTLSIQSLDSDADGLADWREEDLGTDPVEPDTDSDLLLDGVEDDGGIFVDASLTGTDPLLLDTDGDGFDDGDEVSRGSDPNDSRSTP